MEKERRNFAWRFFKSCAASFLMPSWWCLSALPLILPTSFTHTTAAERLCLRKIPFAFCQPNLTMEGGSLVVSTFLQGKETRFFAAAAAVTCNVKRGRRGNFKSKKTCTKQTRQPQLGKKYGSIFDDQRIGDWRKNVSRGIWWRERIWIWCSLDWSALHVRVKCVVVLLNNNQWVKVDDLNIDNMTI